MTRSAAVPTSLLALVLLAGGCGYNTIQTMDEEVNQAKGQIETQLQRRADLVPNLVETVKGVAKQESTIFTSIAESRARLSGAVQSGDVGEMAEANQALTQGIGRLLAIVENYPELRSSESFRALQDQLEGTENRISVARQDYNAAVGKYNAYIRRFPYNLTAKIFGQGAAGVLRGGAGGGGGAEGGVLGSGTAERRSSEAVKRPRTRAPLRWDVLLLTAPAAPLLRLVRHHMLRQHISQRIHRPAIDVHLVVQVGAGGEAGVADQRDPLAARDALAFADEDLRGVGELGHRPEAVVDHDRVAVARLPSRVPHHAGGGRLDRAAHRSRHVDALVGAGHVQDRMRRASRRRRW